MLVFFRHVAIPPGSQSRQHRGNRIRLARDSLFPHQVDAGIGDRSPDRRIGVVVDIGLHDRENHRNEGRHDPASIMHLGLAPPFGKGCSAMEDLVPKRVEPVKDDSQHPVNILSRQLPAHARCLPFESHQPIGTFRRTLHPLPKNLPIRAIGGVACGVVEEV